MASTTYTPHSSRPSSGSVPGVVSRHHTSAGTVLWSRCVCGRLRMTYAPDPVATTGPAERPLTAGGSTPGCPVCG